MSLLPWVDPCDPDHATALGLLVVTLGVWTWACWSGAWRSLRRGGGR